MNTLKLTKEDAQECEHKFTILSDEPELQEDYGISQERADELLASVPLNGGEWTVPEWALEAVSGEFENHAEVLRDMAADARSENQFGAALRLCKLAKRFEGFAEQLTARPAEGEGRRRIYEH